MERSRRDALAAAAGVQYARARSGLQTVARHAATIPSWCLLVPLILAQWAVTIAIARNATHNGWLYYHGGDGTYYWTTTWSLAHHHLPETVISYGLPVFLWPLGLVFGANMLAGLPAVIVLQVVVLAPLGVLAMYGLAARIGGRLFGYAATLAWVLAPPIVLAILRSYGEPPFDSKVLNLVFPNALGLTNIADYASMILALTATFLVLRALDERRWDDVVLAGLTTGMLIAVKPANGFYLPIPLIAFALCRRWREGVVFAALLLPALLTLTVWKKIGLGSIPIAAPPPTRTLAVGNGLLPSGPGLARYELFDWNTLRWNFWELSDASRGFEALVLLWIVGLVGLIRRTLIPGIMIGIWCVSYLVFKGAARGRASVEATSAFKLVIPAYPAFVLLLVAGVFVVVSGTLLLRWRPRSALPAATVQAPTRVSLAAALVLAVYPLMFVATTRPWTTERVVKDNAANVLVPISDELRATAVVEPHGVRLSWKRPEQGRSRIWFAVLRAKQATDCTERTAGAHDCVLTDSRAAGYTRRTSFVDRSRRTTDVTYRIGMLAGWAGDLANADMLLVGPPIHVARNGSTAGG